MMNKVVRSIRNFLAPHAYGVMVVNGSYYRPLAHGKDSIGYHALNNDQYLELCETIREAR